MPESKKHKELKKEVKSELKKLGFNEIYEEVSICTKKEKNKQGGNVEFRADIMANLNGRCFFVECGNIVKEKLKKIRRKSFLKIIHIPYNCNVTEELSKRVNERLKKEEKK